MVTFLLLLIGISANTRDGDSDAFHLYCKSMKVNPPTNNNFRTVTYGLKYFWDEQCFLYRYLLMLQAINNKYDLNLSTFICFSKRCKDLRSSKYQQLLPVKRCRKFSTRDSFFQRVCDYSNFLATKEIDVFDPTEKFKRELMAYLRNQVPMFNLDRSCSWFIKCLCSICRS